MNGLATLTPLLVILKEYGLGGVDYIISLEK